MQEKYQKMILAGLLVMTAIIFSYQVAYGYTATIKPEGAGGAAIGGFAGHVFCGPICGIVGGYIGDKIGDSWGSGDGN
jgi:hypothetical protein